MAFKTRTTEQIEARAYIEWCYRQTLLRPLVIHIPNEGKRNPVTGHFMRLMGLRPGVSDFFIPLPTKLHHGLWIELKTKWGKVTSSQKEWIDKMKALSYEAHVAHGWEEAKELTEAYLDNLKTE